MVRVVRSSPYYEDTNHSRMLDKAKLLGLNGDSDQVFRCIREARDANALMYGETGVHGPELERLHVERDPKV